MKQKVVNIARDYTLYPGGRTEEDGPGSGATFRDKILLPFILDAERSNETVLVDFDGPPGYGTSFLEEVFGGLIRNHNFTKQRIENILRYKSETENTIRLVNQYINNAEEKRISK
jgi:hypothetical protein